MAAAIALEQTFGESSKLLFGRPRPSRELVAVMGNPTGLSFPSTFMTLYSVTIGALLVLAWRMKPSGLRSGVLAASGAGAARRRGRAHRARRALAERRLRHAC